MVERPQVKYAKSGEVNVAYQVFGEGDIDLVLVFGFISHLDLFWDGAPFVEMAAKLGKFARVIMFDKRGVGLSDPVATVPTLEERMDDVRAVMDAAGSKQAVVMGSSEGGPMAILFASTFPERTRALILYGSMARTTEDGDYPWAASEEALRESTQTFMAPDWGSGSSVEIFSPSLADQPGSREFYARLERMSASPSMVLQLMEMFLQIDVRHVLPSIHVPTLILHRKGDKVVNVRAARYLAEQIEGSRLIELDGVDHNMLAGDTTVVLEEIEEFITGVRPVREPDRVLATVMFTDIVDSTRTAAEMGDARWREVLEEHQRIVRTQLGVYRGVEVKNTGDGVLATFDGPARAVRCAVAITDAVEMLGLRVRVGIHTGECELIGNDVGGIAVHTAARVSALAGPGEVLVSRTVKDLVAGSGIAFEDRGTHELKGVPDQWQLLLVTGLTS